MMNESILLTAAIGAIVLSTILAARVYREMNEHTLCALIAATLGFMFFVILGDAFSAALVLVWGYALAWALEWAQERQHWQPVPAPAVRPKAKVVAL